jgi:hypothetical protein
MNCIDKEFKEREFKEREFNEREFNEREFNEKSIRYDKLKENVQQFIEEYNKVYPNQTISFKWSQRKHKKQYNPYNPYNFTLDHSDELTIEDLSSIFLDSYFLKLRNFFFENGGMESVFYSEDNSIRKYVVSSF